MRIVRIKNKYLFRSKNPEGIHDYAVYYDRKGKEMRAVYLTHLYNEDPIRFRDLKRGFIKKVKFKEMELPSGVNNLYYATDYNGNKINLKSPEVVKVGKRYLPKNQSIDIKRFAKRRYECGSWVLDKKGKRKPLE
ncbi:MAG: hypothetical protein LBT30_04880 [Clostridiales bacterium]|jgi:hypothetical protein|nr:hypothetical protein [Clostridiales bacterium]